MRKIISVLLVFVFITSFQLSDNYKQTIIDKDVKATIDSALKSFVDAGKVAGVSALIFEKKTKKCITMHLVMPGVKRMFQWTVIPLFVFTP